MKNPHTELGDLLSNPSLPTVLVSGGCQNKALQPGGGGVGGLTPEKCILSQLWRPKSKITMSAVGSFQSSGETLSQIPSKLLEVSHPWGSLA